ncbi:hypothetical protein RND81_11G153100 [Saponaria officinalis]|uniref:Uncharacterized protein n=1 Tax=Saponaria officinalis TaxID=3572 RepID=A0AAW1HM85_SAPOF
MATTMSSVWAKPGAWALDSEQHEDELNHQHHLDLSAAAVKAPPEPPASDFPSLSAAVTGAAKPKKKSKQVLSLAEFSNYKPPSAIDIVLPTGPRERTAEEIAESRRGGFRNYGDRDSKPRVSREGYDGNFPKERDSMGPSRADDADDWSKGKKLSSFGPGPDRERERDMGPSRADGVDDWSKGKKFGGGFENSRVDRRDKGGFFNSSKADEVDNWASNKGFGPGLGDDRRRERRVGFEATGPGSDVDTWVKHKEVVSGSGSGSGGGRPRLNLQPRTLPVVTNNNNNINNNDNVGGGEAAATVVKGKGNPFGAARPREEVLKEKGKDWKEIDEKLEAVKIKEVERSAAEGFGRRRGFGVGGGDDRSVRSWRKPGSPSNDAPAAAVPAARFDP